MDAVFSPEAIAKLDMAARAMRLDEMQTALVARLSREATVGEFFAQIRHLVDELRSLGHDLWSFDSDGHGFEAYCGDWSRADGGLLSITFRHPDEVEVGWREPTEAGEAETG